jgi:hypothetical protein
MPKKRRTMTTMPESQRRMEEPRLCPALAIVLNGQYIRLTRKQQEADKSMEMQVQAKQRS